MLKLLKNQSKISKNTNNRHTKPKKINHPKKNKNPVATKNKPNKKNNSKYNKIPHRDREVNVPNLPQKSLNIQK